MPFSFDTFREIADNLDEADRWFAGLGLSTSGSRVESLRSLIRELLADMDSLPAEEVVAKWFDNKTYYALADARGFSQIAQELGRMPHMLPRHQLRTILTGPLDPTEENPSDSSVQARNVFAELELAAYLSAKGIEISGFDDVRIRFGGKDLLFECKRIHSTSQIRANVQKAVAQLSAKMPDDQARGFITVVLDRLTGIDRMILRIDHDDEVHAAVREKVEEFLSMYGDEFRAPVDTRILATCFVLHFLVYDVARNMVGTSYTLAFIPYAGQHLLEHSDRQLLEEFAAHASAGV